MSHESNTKDSLKIAWIRNTLSDIDNIIGEIMRNTNYPKPIIQYLFNINAQLFNTQLQVREIHNLLIQYENKQTQTQTPNQSKT